MVALKWSLFITVPRSDRKSAREDAHGAGSDMDRACIVLLSCASLCCAWPLTLIEDGHPAGHVGVPGANCITPSVAPADDTTAATDCLSYCQTNANDRADCNFLWVYKVSSSTPGRCCPKSSTDLFASGDLTGIANNGFFYEVKPSQLILVSDNHPTTGQVGVDGAPCMNPSVLSSNDGIAASNCLTYCQENADDPLDCRWLWVYEADHSSNGRCCPKSKPGSATGATGNGGNGFWFRVESAVEFRMGVVNRELDALRTEVGSLRRNNTDLAAEVAALREETMCASSRMVDGYCEISARSGTDSVGLRLRG